MKVTVKDIHRMLSSGKTFGYCSCGREVEYSKEHIDNVCPLCGAELIWRMKVWTTPNTSQRKEVFKMVKIIKPGTKQKITCCECGCIFSFEDEDIEHITFEIHQIKCPQCGNDICISQRR